MHVTLLSELSEQLQDQIITNDISEIGSTYHQALLLVAENGGYCPQTLYAVSPTKLAVETLEGENANIRLQEARVIGREIADEFGVSPVHYLIQQAICVTSEKGSGFMPNDDPYRKQIGLTIVASTLPFCRAKSLKEHMHHLVDWDVRIWFTHLHEGAVVEHQWSDALVVSPINYENGQYDKDNENIAVISSGILTEAIVGMSAMFPGISVKDKKSPIEQAISVELKTRETDAVYEEMVSDGTIVPPTPAD